MDFRAGILRAQDEETKGTAVQEWEYAIADFAKLEGAVPELDRLGAEGWEAVGLVSMWGPGWSSVQPVVLLKRPRRESAQRGSRDGTTRRVA